jgi:guanylate kinase
MRKGPLVILSGPSGSGKTTVIDRLMRTSDLAPRLRKAVTATTRAPRGNEADGQSYHFWGPECFQKAIEGGELLEWAQVHGKDYYGTPRSEVEPYREQGLSVILVIDVQGAAQIRRLYPGDHLSVFLTAETVEEYERRLRLRGEDDEAVIQRRLRTAREELTHQPEYMLTIVNDDLAKAVTELEAAIRQRF